MNRFIVLFIPVFLLSCGVFRTVEKEKHSLDVKSNLKRDSVVHLDKNTVDRSKTIIQESIKGSFHSPPVEAAWYTSLHPDSVLRSQVFRTDKGLFEITSVLNKTGTGIDQKAKFTPDPIAVDIDRTTVIENDISIQENSNIEISYEWDLGIKQSESNVRKEGKNVYWWIIFVIILLVGIYKIRL